MYAGERKLSVNKRKDERRVCVCVYSISACVFVWYSVCVCVIAFFPVLVSPI